MNGLARSWIKLNFVEGIDMDFSRRRFLTIASAALVGQFIPLATHGAAKEIVAVTPDRYALVANAWREALDILPADWIIKRKAMLMPRNNSDEYMAIAKVFSKKADDAISLMLDHFEKIPTSVEIRESFANRVEIGSMDEERLRELSEQLLPITTIKTIITEFKGPIIPQTMKSFDEFIAKHHDVILGAAGRK